MLISTLQKCAAGQKVNSGSMAQAYTAVRFYLQQMYPSVDLFLFDQGTLSLEKQTLLTEQLQNAHVDQDLQLLQYMLQLFELLADQPQATAEALGVNLQNVKAESIQIQDVIVNVSRNPELPTPGEPPYKGLEFFDVNDADLFFWT